MLELGGTLYPPVWDVDSTFGEVHGQAITYLSARAPLNPAYFRRIEAIEFAVKYDDGLGAGLDEADIVLVGVSRTSKTARRSLPGNTRPPAATPTSESLSRRGM